MWGRRHVNRQFVESASRGTHVVRGSQKRHLIFSHPESLATRPSALAKPPRITGHAARLVLHELTFWSSRPLKRASSIARCTGHQHRHSPLDSACVEAWVQDASEGEIVVGKPWLRSRGGQRGKGRSIDLQSCRWQTGACTCGLGTFSQFSLHASFPVALAIAEQDTTLLGMAVCTFTL